MNNFLASNNSDLTNVRVGLGHYSLNSTRGKILVPAAPLGAADTLTTVDSQRYKLKQAVDLLKASGSTPTATAYAEAAAYLMGTTTAPTPIQVTLVERMSRSIFNVIVS